MGSEFGYCPSKPTAGDHFIVEDLLDFPHDDDGAATFDGLAAGDSNFLDSSSSSSTSCFSTNPYFEFPPPADFPFSGDLCLPNDDLAELEWLSNFVEESFSSEDLQKIQLISGMSAMKTRPDEDSETRFYHPYPTRPVDAQSPICRPDIPVPGKARSKRSRAAQGNWASCLVLHSPTAQPDPSKPAKGTPKKRVGGGLGADPARGDPRRCLHCATEKTPQWRAGPMGPKTLCNACGVRYKSGRLVPEYRPAASPTFVLSKHSNSHRKVMELRRQKESMRQQQLQQ